MREDRREERRETREQENLQINRGLLAAAQASATAAKASALIAVLAVGLTLYQAWQSRTDAETARTNAVATAKQSRLDNQHQFDQQLDAQHQLLDQTARSAKAAEASALTASQALHISERAYIAVTVTLESPIRAGQIAAMKIIVENTGRTPALDLQSKTCVRTIPAALPIEEAHRDASLTCKPTTTPVTLSPGKQSPQDASSPSEFTREQTDPLANQTNVLYVFVFTTYSDIFGKKHHSEVCGKLRPDLTVFDVCTAFNHED